MYKVKCTLHVQAERFAPAERGRLRAAAVNWETAAGRYSSVVRVVVASSWPRQLRRQPRHGTDETRRLYRYTSGTIHSTLPRLRMKFRERTFLSCRYNGSESNLI